MKKTVSFFLAAVLLCLFSAAFATTEHTLPSEISSYFNTDVFEGSVVLDCADLSGHGTDDCWFVLIRTKSGENVLYYFKQKDGVWKETYHTSDAVPQTKHGVRVGISESGQEGFAGFMFSKPHLYIGQENDEGEYWEFTVIYELQNGQWMLHRIWSYTGYSNMLIQRDRIVFYKDIESDREVGVVKGIVQRDLRYVSLSTIPRTLSEAKAKLTVAPDLPKSAELKVYPVSFSGKKTFDVYSAPDATSLRGSNGKARVSTNSWIQVFGTEDDWVLIQYSIDASHYRFGYISDKSLPKKANVPALQFNKTSAWTTKAVNVTDDPLYSQSSLVSIPEGCRVTWLASLGDWAYIESTTGDYLRGFVPVKSLRINQEFDLRNIPMGETVLLEGTLSVDSSGRTVTARFRPVNGGPLEGKQIGSFDLTDPVHQILFASLTEKDPDGFYSAVFTIPADTTVIQITALPEYGFMDSWGGEKAISVEW